MARGRDREWEKDWEDEKEEGKEKATHNEKLLIIQMKKKSFRDGEALVKPEKVLGLKKIKKNRDGEFEIKKKEE